MADLDYGANESELGSLGGGPYTSFTTDGSGVFDGDGSGSEEDLRRKFLRSRSTGVQALRRRSSFPQNTENPLTPADADAGSGSDSLPQGSHPDHFDLATTHDWGPFTTPGDADLPATPRARNLQQEYDKLRGTGQPTTMKGKIIDALTSTLPVMAAAGLGGPDAAAGAAEGLNQANTQMLQRRQLERKEVGGQLEQEYGRMERERALGIQSQEAEARLKEAQTWHEVAAEQRQQGLNRQDEGQDLAITKAGLTKDPATGKLVDDPSNPFGALRKAQTEYKQAQTEMEQAKLKNLPEEMEQKRQRLQITLQNYNLALRRIAQGDTRIGIQQANFIANEGTTPGAVLEGGVDAIPGAPVLDGQAVGTRVYNAQTSGQTKSRASASGSAVSMANNLSHMIDSPLDPNNPHGPTIASRLGPIMGRFSMAEMLAGNVPPELSNFAAQLQQYYSIATTAHGWRSAEAPEKFAQAVGWLSRDPEALRRGILGLAEGMKTIQGAAAQPASGQMNRGTKKLQKAGPAAQAGAATGDGQTSNPGQQGAATVLRGHYDSRLGKIVYH